MLGFHLGGDAHLFNQPGHVNAARSAGVADRLGCEQRLLQRCAGADVRPWRAGAHRDADARLGQIDPAAGNDLALPDQLVQLGAGDDDRS